MFDHIQQLIDQYEINHIYLSDDNFTSDNVMVERVCNKFRDRNWELTWDTRGRVNDMDLDLLRKMKQAGCSEILIGIESSDDFVLKNMNKRIISDQQYQAVINVMEAGIVPILSLILEYKKETESSINNTIHLLLKLYRIEKPIVAYFHICSIVPGTRLYDKNVDSLLKNGAEEIIKKLKYGDIYIK